MYFAKKLLGWLTAPRLTALIIFWQNTLPANIRKWVFSWNNTWWNYKFAWNSWQACVNFRPRLYKVSRVVIMKFEALSLCSVNCEMIEMLSYYKLIKNFHKPIDFLSSHFWWMTCLWPNIMAIHFLCCLIWFILSNWYHRPDGWASDYIIYHGIYSTIQ